MALYSTSSAEAFLRASCWNQRFLTTKWFVPGGVEAADDGGSGAVERTEDPIAFSGILLRSFFAFSQGYVVLLLFLQAPFM
jgi:hypothetical protein